MENNTEKIVFYYSSFCPYSIKAKEIIDVINKKLNIFYEEYDVTKNNEIPDIFNVNEYPILFILKNEKIKKTIKGFTSYKDQLEIYEKEIEELKNEK
jgi:thiol-disulfide isomerase/thioredoxin